MNNKVDNSPATTRVSLAKNYVSQAEDALRELGLWSQSPLQREQLGFTEPFGADTMTFAEWLQFIFLPRVSEMLSNLGQLPKTSEVAAYAMREYAEKPDCAPLVSALQAFDDVVNFRPKIREFCTFNTGSVPPNDKKREWNINFYQDDTSNIGWQVEVDHPTLHRNLETEWEVIFTDESGTTQLRRRVTAVTLANTGESFHYGRFHWSESESWPLGRWHTALKLWNEPIAQNWFRVVERLI